MPSEHDFQSIALVFTADPPLGGGSMTMTLLVDTTTGAAHGHAKGTALDGTQQPLYFYANGVSGAVDDTGEQVFGGVSGTACVNPFPTGLVYPAPFNASFYVGESGTGIGKFAVGNTSYQCTAEKL